MEVEEAATFSTCSPDSVNEESSATEQHNSSSENPLSTNASCFDCNICLSFAADPVVTLCGHLYCWPCIYRWLHLDSLDVRSSRCPVCRSLFSESSLIPLYASSGLSAKSHGIPDRPKPQRKLHSLNRRQQIYPFRNQQHFFRTLYRSPEGNRGRRRRTWQELRAESFLNQLWGFLFCCSVLCFLFF